MNWTMTRLAYARPLIAAVLLTVGCGENKTQADPPAPGQGTAQSAPTTQPSTPSQPSSPSEPAAPAAPTVDRPITIAQPETYVVHKHAGRSPFPQPGESIDTLIPARRITDADPFANPIDPADIPAVVPWDQAARYVGHQITVEGTIVRVGKSGQTNFLNFAQDYRGKFYMVIFDDLAATLDADVQATFEGKTLRVRGTVESHRGTPQIKITSMDQVQFID